MTLAYSHENHDLLIGPCWKTTDPQSIPGTHWTTQTTHDDTVHRLRKCYAAWLALQKQVDEGSGSATLLSGWCLSGCGHKWHRFPWHFRKNGDVFHGCSYWIAFPARIGYHGSTHFLLSYFMLLHVNSYIFLHNHHIFLHNLTYISHTVLPVHPVTCRHGPLNISSLWVHRYDTLPLLKPAPPQRYKSAAWTRSITVVVSYLTMKASDASDTISITQHTAQRHQSAFKVLS